MATDAELRDLIAKWRKTETAYAVMHQRVCHYGACADELESLLASKGSEQAARERLGRWLTSGLGRSFEREEHCDCLEWRRRVLLVIDGCETIYGPWIRTADASGCPDNALDDHEAINAALDAAERSEFEPIRGAAGKAADDVLRKVLDAAGRSGK